MVQITSKSMRVPHKLQRAASFLFRYTKAFPDVPWVYIYRDPLEIIASHIKAGETFVANSRVGPGPPCLRKRCAVAVTTLGLFVGLSSELDAL